jgi:hypothetical protein
MLDFHEAAENHFQTDLVKMQKLLENRHFHISTAIFTAMQSRPTRGHHSQCGDDHTKRLP